MPKYISAKEFRRRFPDMAEELKHSAEIIVLKRSKPLFKVIPFEEFPSDLLDRASLCEDRAQPQLEEISKIVHKIREVS